MNLQITIDASDLLSAADIVAESAMAFIDAPKRGRKRDQAEGFLRIAVADYTRKKKNLMVVGL